MTITPKKIRLMGAPMDLGADHRGVDMGPSAIRIAGVRDALQALGHSVRDIGDCPVPVPETRDPGDVNAKYLDEIVTACDRLREQVHDAFDHGEVPVVMGGDHSIAVGSVTGVAEYYRGRGEGIGVIWVDAHADMNTPESSPSGNVHGMPLSALLGFGADELVNLGGFAPKVDPAHVALIGIRALDDHEKEIVRRSGINAYTMRDIDHRGMGEIVDEAMERVSKAAAGFHVSFDLDGMDPAYAPGVGTPVRGGINWREANLLMEHVYDSGKMLSCEITELNPILDIRNQSGEVAVDLLCSAFGKNIL